MTKQILFLYFLLCTFTSFASQGSLLLNAESERIVVNHDDALNPPNAITIEGWIRLSNTTACQTLVGKNFRTGYYLGTCNSKIQSMVAGSSTVRLSDIDINAGEWAHIALTYDGTERVHFFNGNEVFREALSVEMPSNLEALGIGGEGESPTFPSEIYRLDGRISEVRLWDYARTEKQVRSGMIRQFTQDEPGLLAVWPLENSHIDRFERFESNPVPGVSFSGIGSPAVPFDPYKIRSVNSTPIIDGNCESSAYDSFVSVPAWYTESDLPFGEGNPMQIFIAADENNLYVCYPKRTQSFDREFELRLDPDNDQTFTPDEDDLRFTILSNNTLRVQRGQEGFLNSWIDIATPVGVEATRLIGSEFNDFAEFKIPRSLLPTNDAVFGFSTGHKYQVSTFTRRAGWPDDFGAERPGFWQQVTIDLSVPAGSDSINPRLSAISLTSSPAPNTPFSIQLRGRDDVDIELIEIMVDGTLVESCFFDGTSDRNVLCSHSRIYSTGIHRVDAHAFDHAGRYVELRPRQFRVQVDGESPSLIIRSEPPQPLIGESFTITATATDASGIDRIRLNEVLGLRFPSFRDCDFTGNNETESCSWTITGNDRTGHMRFRALAWDQDEYMNDTSDLYVLIGNTGFDRDDDGIADAIEIGMCTDPENPDSDFDSISDLWEAIGVHFSDGTLLPLQDYGVNPCTKDTLLQLDYEVLSPITDATVNMIRQEMRSNGIHAYIDVNERPTPTAYEQSHIGSEAASYQKQDGEFYFAPERLWAFKYGYQRALAGSGGASGPFFTTDGFGGSNGFCFGGSKDGEKCRGDFECPDGGSCGAGCESGEKATESCSSSIDCPLTEGGFASCKVPCTTNPISGSATCRRSNEDYLSTLVFHEYGHTLGLGHGGRQGDREPTTTGGFVTRFNKWDDDNYKSNHLSIMNYRYFFTGIECLNPQPFPLPVDYSLDTTGRPSFADIGLGDIDENLLDESADSLISTRLQAINCSHASPGATAIFRYVCEIDGKKAEVISNGLKAVGIKKEGQSWNYNPDNPSSEGIDWNCNGIIESMQVASDTNGNGGLQSNIRGRDEWSFIPNSTQCQMIYKGSCENPAKSCYLGSDEYRASIPTLANGLPPIDCREKFLQGRLADSEECALLPESDFPKTTCPLISLDTVNSRSFGEGQPILEETEELPPPDPGVDFELCDFVDNDGDGNIDENCADNDMDGLVDLQDNCPTIANADQADRDKDGLGDICQYPEILTLLADYNGTQVTLNWTSDDTPIRGYTVYRSGEINGTTVLLGDGYPSTFQTVIKDFVSQPDYYTYSVRALNMNGQEGDVMFAEVTVGDPDLIFAHSFENSANR
ncbi:MAG: LamG-like jellyroll fold domain-containing protein [Marinicellaceae bacterium]